MSDDRPLPKIKFIDPQPAASNEFLAGDNGQEFRFGSWTSPNEEALIDDIAAFDPALTAMLSEHQKEYETILSTLFMHDVARWATDRYQAGLHDFVAYFLSLLERHYENGDEHVRNLIAVGFLESMPASVAPLGDMRTLLGPRLAQVFREVNW